MKLRQKNYFRPKLGQHFLIDNSVVEKIVKLANLSRDATVVEIGPGEGILTRALNVAVSDGQVLALEIDFDLVNKLRERVSKRVKIIHTNALDFDYETVTRPYHVVTNLPYQITSPILHKLIGSKNPPESMTIMIQKEVAERLLAPPHTRERGLLTVVAEWYGKVEFGFNVPPTAFNPPPKVESTVIKLIKEPTPRVGLKPPFEQFLKFLKVGFSQKRRQIHHPFSSRYPTLKKEINKIFESVDIDRTQRAEELSFEQWVRLYYKFIEFIK